MNQTPLKVQTALAIIANKEMSLDTILLSLENPTTAEEHCISHVAADAQFWRCLIERYLDKTILVDRLDITEDKYEVFVRNCNAGVTHLYFVKCDFSFLRAGIEGPTLYYHGLKDDTYRKIKREIEEDAEHQINEDHDLYFELSGLPIEKSSFGYVVKYHIDDLYEEEPCPATTFIWTNSEDQEMMFDRLVTYVTKSFYYHFENDFLPNSINDRPEGIRIENTHFEDIPDIDRIKSLFFDILNSYDEHREAKLSEFRHDGTLSARVFNVHVNNNTVIQNDMYYMNMSIKIAQLSF
jgi:hypothetical protein